MSCSKSLLSLQRIENIETNVSILLKNLELLDESFSPAFSSFINLGEYAKKLIKYAHIYEVRYKDDFAGLSAFYVNNEYSFITFIAVLPFYKGKGTAQLLLNRIIETSRESGVPEVQLEVRRDNINAIRFYEKNDFQISEFKAKNDLFYYMIKSL